MIFILSPSLSKAETLEGGIEKVWSVDLAREEAFRDAKQWIDLSKYSPTDPNFPENKALINKDQLDNKDRLITTYSDGWYSVKYYNTITESYYYDTQGNLKEVDYSFFAKNIYSIEDAAKYPYESLFPVKRYKHAYPRGKIIGVGIDVKWDENYLFKLNGELKSHCIGGNCYDGNNNIILNRSTE